MYLHVLKLQNVLNDLQKSNIVTYIDKISLLICRLVSQLFGEDSGVKSINFV